MLKKVSIIIPCRNEKGYIEKCLNSIINCNYSKELLSIYVCDGLSSDGSAEIIKNYEKEFPFIFYRENNMLTTPFALNLGIKESTSEIDIILGAHAEIHPDFVLNCVKGFELDAQIGCVGGIIENIYESKTSEAIGKAMSSSFGVGNAYFRTGTKDGYVDTVAFGAYKKDVFAQLGYFDEDLARNQDDEFNFRLQKNGFKIYLMKNIISKYFVRASFRKLFRQYYQYGYWKVFVNKKHSTVTTARQLFPAMFVLFIVCGLILSFISNYFLIAYFSVWIVYFLLAIVSAIKINKAVSGIGSIIFSFLILHTSYGIGYLEGIMKFIILGQMPKKSSVQLSR